MNEEVRNRIQNAIGVHDGLLTMMKRKLRWYGHISRSSGMAKTILQGTVKGARRRGRQKKRWEDDVNGVWRFPEGSGRQGMVERYCCNVICGAPTTSEVKGLRWDEMRYKKTFLKKASERLVVGIWNYASKFCIKVSHIISMPFRERSVSVGFFKKLLSSFWTVYIPDKKNNFYVYMNHNRT